MKVSSVGLNAVASNMSMCFNYTVMVHAFGVQATGLDSSEVEAISGLNRFRTVLACVLAVTCRMLKEQFNHQMAEAQTGDRTALGYIENCKTTKANTAPKQGKKYVDTPLETDTACVSALLALPNAISNIVYFPKF